MHFQDIRGALKENYNLAHLTWFKTGGAAEFFFKPADEQDLITILKQFDSSKGLTILGAGSNLIIRDKGIKGLVIKLARNFTNITNDTENGRLKVGAGCLNYNLAKFAQGHDMGGFEFLIGIPGCVGGGVVMNAGSYGQEFKDIIEFVHYIDFDGNKHCIPRSEIEFGYRKSSLPDNIIITAVEFKYIPASRDAIQSKMDEISQARSESQPITEKTSGSTFANPYPHRAWELIDKVGMRGYRVGGAIMSPKHCNFIVNEGDATSSDIEELGETVRNKVLSETGIDLKWEIRRLGEK